MLGVWSDQSASGGWQLQLLVLLGSWLSLLESEEWLRRVSMPCRTAIYAAFALGALYLLVSATVGMVD